MPAVMVTIAKFISNHQPGWVECRLIDAWGKEWLFHEKVPVVTLENLDERSSYPRKGIIACQIINRRIMPDGQEIVTIDTEKPWDVDALSGETQFEVMPNQLTDY